MTETETSLSAASCRAARTLLGLSEQDFAALAGISVVTLRRFELGEASRSRYAATAISAALTREGVIFVGPAEKPQLK